MKAKILLNFLKELSAQELEKEITFYDYKARISHQTASELIVVDLSDDKYLDLVFNIDEDDIPYKVYEKNECPIHNTICCEECELNARNVCLIESENSSLCLNDTE